MPQQTPSAETVGAPQRFRASGFINARDRNNMRRFVGWALLWLLTSNSTAYGINLEVLQKGAWLYLAIALSVALGIVTVLAFIRGVREGDELQRKILLEASALGVAGAVVAKEAISLLEKAEIMMPVPWLNPNSIMWLCFAAGVFFSWRRYA